ncbi:MAG TPA: PIG-L family deacetylase [Anaerolineaceae bacterium]|nr:PIG-L family deacetylase [Anaerolineaceae bacterium]
MNNDLSFFGRRICFIGAHPDDIELGAGALIAHIANQTDVRCVTLSDNQKNPALTNIVREHYASMEVLGIAQDKVIVKDFETRRFPHFRQEILEYLITLNLEYHPEIVFTHTKNDLHQDHATVTEECLRAFRGTTLLGFDVLRSSYGFFPNFLVEVNQTDVDKKIAALAEYKTYESKYYFDPQITRATLIRHGALAERPYAEGFDILRVIGSFTCIQ